MVEANETYAKNNKNISTVLDQNTCFLAAIFISFIFLVVTIAGPFLPPIFSALDRILELGSLRAEKNFAAWWSGMLLLTTSVLAFDHWAAHRQQNPRLARGWLFLALIIGALSVDEISSLHERLSYFPAGMWKMLVPFALTFLGMFLVTATAFWGDAEHRRKLFGIATAFGLFGLVAVQEYIEHAVAFPEHLLSIRAGIEEGTELVAMLILLKIALRGKGDQMQPTSFFYMPEKFRLPAVVIGIFVCPMLAIVTTSFPDIDVRGNPADWLASSVFLLAAFLAIRNRFEKKGFPGLLTAFVCILGSLAIVLEPQNSVTLMSAEFNKRLLIYSVVMAGTFVDWWRGDRSQQGASLVFVSSMMVLMVSYGATWETPAIYYLLPQFIALAIYWFVGQAASPTPAIAADKASRLQSVETGDGYQRGQTAITR